MKKKIKLKKLQFKLKGFKFKVSKKILFIIILITLLLIVAGNFVTIKIIKDRQAIEKEKEEVIEVPTRVEVYEGMTLEELTAKLDRSLTNELSGTGSLYASLSIEYGIDPYLAVAITLHETGCKWNCSSLMVKCHNVGGVVGSPSCGGGYKYYSTLEEGINDYFLNLYENYYSVGLNTVDMIANRYAASTTWSTKIKEYIEYVRAN